MDTPFSTGTNAPAFAVPEGACDCHMHLFDNASPYAGPDVLKHPDATPQDYRALQRRLGTSRNVVVQPSSYGLDNRVLVAGLKALGDSARGVAVVDPTATASQLLDLEDAGVVGVRFNLVQAGATHERMLEDVAELIRPFGWHIQIHAHAATLIGLADRLIRLPVPVVIDHYARLNVFPELRPGLEDSVFRLLSTGCAWLKLSAPYIASPQSTAYEDLESFAQRLSAKYPDRLVWGTDWPHVTERGYKPDDAVLMGLLSRWFSADEITRILVDNPRALYGFDIQEERRTDCDSIAPGSDAMRRPHWAARG
ncbi:amidohydrolase family protein [Variovorax sp. CAN2819]|uniref:amidohydrolase family protein n=1 Tax=Variovorax sp. CAN15 TaxID=3046727 RepID=UPI002649AF4B|nr:amidohydrolase family protein [Variovorax sp. CAN15]MDN6885873.1 amidohydrolase family protein [Variovorax sp. CAN15]